MPRLEVDRVRVEVGARCACGDPGQFDRVGPTRHSSGAPPAVLLELPAQHSCEMARLPGQARVERGDFCVARRGRDPGHRRRPTTRRPLEYKSALEQHEIAQPPPDVAHGRREQAGQQEGAQLRLVLGQRVHQPSRLPARIVGRQAESVVDGR
jgi:hypothetical protein